MLTTPQITANDNSRCNDSEVGKPRRSSKKTYFHKVSKDIESWKCLVWYLKHFTTLCISQTLISCHRKKRFISNILNVNIWHNFLSYTKNFNFQLTDIFLSWLNFINHLRHWFALNNELLKQNILLIHHRILLIYKIHLE